MLRATGQAPALEPQPEPEPARPQLSNETRGIVARLVEDGRVDLVLAIVERKISPFQASRLAYSKRRRTISDNHNKRPTHAVEEAPEPKKPTELPFDPARLIA